MSLVLLGVWTCTTDIFEIVFTFFNFFFFFLKTINRIENLFIKNNNSENESTKYRC